MKAMRGKRLLSGNGGVAMTETALLCLFLYVPVLMMVIIWGDMTLDKTRAHAAGAYVAFSGRAPDEAQVREIFFPGADGMEDGLGSVRSVRVDAEIMEGPRYELPYPPSGTYSGDPPEYDLQYKLYSLAMGRIWITTHIDASGDDMNVIYRLHQARNDMARYLEAHGIVDIELPDELPPVRPGENIDFDTGGESRAYTGYVEVLTGMFNDALIGRMPRGEAVALLDTGFRSPFFRDLSRRYRRTGRYDERVQGGLPDVFEMSFGPAGRLASPWSGDDTFHTGYAYLRNPDAGPDGDLLLDALAMIGTDGLLPRTRSMFRQTVSVNGEDVDVNPGAMWELPPLSAETGPDHERFLTPGDPR